MSSMIKRLNFDRTHAREQHNQASTNTIDVHCEHSIYLHRQCKHRMLGYTQRPLYACVCLGTAESLND